MAHVVHLEDDVPLQLILKIAFEAAEPTVQLKQFITGDDALRYSAPHIHDIDLFILDIRVPGSLDGLQVAQRLRELGCTAPVMVSSAYGKPQSEFLMRYQCEWIGKPWYLTETIKHLLDAVQRRGQSHGPLSAGSPSQ
ncbi:MAG: response regulator [Anaerolineae bacterium]|nr:response regulator [Anaerolineae bacterium]